MARRRIDIKIEEPGRDQGKLFKITEMSAFDTEKWAIRSINAILRTVQVQDYAVVFPIIFSYMNGVNRLDAEGEQEVISEVQKGLEAGKYTLDNPLEALALYFSNAFFSLPYEDLINVSDPLLSCCSIYLDPAKTPQLTEPISNNPTLYIEEPSTLLILKREAFKLHTDFFIKASIPFLNRSKEAHAPA